MKIMMFAHGGSQNRGCEAIVRSSTDIIKEAIKGSRVFLASEKPKTDTIISNLDGIFDGSKTNIKKYSLDWLISAFTFKIFSDESYALRKIEKNIISRLREMDIILSIGGDNYCYGEQPGWYEIDRRAKAEGKKLVLWGCSIGEEDLSARKLKDLKLFDLILARESLTYQLLKDNGLPNVKLCADPAFTMGKEELELPKGWKEDKVVGLNFSPLVLSRNKNSKNAVKDLIVHILDSTNLTIALTPHVIQEGNNDYEVLKDYYHEFKHTDRVLLLPNNLTAMQYKGYIARMRFFIGARTHATIAAYSSYVPTMVLGYSVKSKGIAKDIFGREKLVLGIDEISGSNMMKNRFDQMLYEESKLREELKTSIPNIKRMSYKAVDYLKELAN